MSVRVEGLIKRYGDVVAVNGISLEVKDGEFVALLGASGCGKTTTLRTIAGLERPDGGRIFIGDRLVAGPGAFIPPEKRDIGMIFQSYAIWPHMTVFDNVAYGLRIKGLNGAELKRRVADGLELVRLSQYAHRLATDLSGGQQQRVALARSIVIEPSVLFFDEPLSNLDAKLRDRMRFEIRAIQKKLGVTCIYVTHDQAEAMAIADRIVVMKDGEILQIGSPEEIYERPSNAFVADFIGLINLYAANTHTQNADGTTTIQTEHGQEIVVNLNGARFKNGFSVAFRPENVNLLSPGEIEAHSTVNTWPVKVTAAAYQGNVMDLMLDWFGQSVRVQISPNKFKRIALEENVCYVQVPVEQVLVVPNIET